MPDGYGRRVYVLSPRSLSPEAIAVTFAKTSRSPLSFDQIAAQLSDGQSAEFHEKWVVGYGHASVAEHAVLHIAFENVSRLAIECIESNRLASYTEKSSRYQTWEVGSYYLPREVMGAADEPAYRETCEHSLRTYRHCLDRVQELIAAQFPRQDGETEKQWDGRIRSHYADCCRFLLPAAALSNVGMTVNARALEHAICKMLSHPLDEVRQIGQQAKEVAQQEAPTLVKYAAAVPYLQRTEADLREDAALLSARGGTGPVRLIAFDAEAEVRVLAAALYAHARGSFEDILAHVQALDSKGRRRLAHTLLGRLQQFDVPLRALEHACYTFDALMDQGAYFEVKRHRMMSQTPQPLTAELGYAVPRRIAEAGCERVYREAMDQAGEVYRQLAKWNPHVASYVVPNAYNRRLLMTLNLREAYQFCELRSAANAHFSVRRIALCVAEAIREAHPLLAAYMRLPPDTHWKQIEQEHFVQV